MTIWRTFVAIRRQFGAMLSRSRATAGTDGKDRWWIRSAADSVYSGFKERCRKSELESEAITGCAGVDGRPSGVLPMKIASHCREQTRRVYRGTVFGAQNEIPARPVLAEAEPFCGEDRKAQSSAKGVKG